MNWTLKGVQWELFTLNQMVKQMIWVFGENNRMISFDADSNLIYNDQPLTGYLVFYNIFCLDCDEFT